MLRSTIKRGLSDYSMLIGAMIHLKIYVRHESLQRTVCMIEHSVTLVMC